MPESLYLRVVINEANRTQIGILDLFRGRWGKIASGFSFMVFEFLQRLDGEF